MAIVTAWEPQHPGPDSDALPCPWEPWLRGRWVPSRVRAQAGPWTQAHTALRQRGVLGKQGPRPCGLRCPLTGSSEPCQASYLPPRAIAWEKVLRLCRLVSRAWAGFQAFILGQRSTCADVHGSCGTAPSPPASPEASFSLFRPSWQCSPPAPCPDCKAHPQPTKSPGESPLSICGLASPAPQEMLGSCGPEAPGPHPCTGQREG